MMIYLLLSTLTVFISFTEMKAFSPLEKKLKSHFPQIEHTEFDLPVTINAEVLKWIRYYQGKGKDFFRRYVERSGKYAPIMASILEEQGLPRDLIFVAMAESGLSNHAISSANAVGPWQFMRATAEKYGLKVNSFVDERRDPIKATIAAGRYFKDLFALFGQWELAAAAYNAGEGRILKFIQKQDSLCKETREYVPRIFAMAILGKNLNSFNLQKDLNFHTPMNFEEIFLPGHSDLNTFSKAINLKYQEIEKLNPELNRPLTPPFEEFYPLRVPIGYKKIYDHCCKFYDFTALAEENYTVEKTTEWKELASKLNIPTKLLKRLNQIELTSPQISETLLPGQTIKIPEDSYSLAPTDSSRVERKNTIKKNRYRHRQVLGGP